MNKAKINNCPILCLAIGASRIKDRLESYLRTEVELHFIAARDDSIWHIKKKGIQCVILHMEKRIDALVSKTETLKKNFPDIPIVAIIEPNVKIDVIRKCGEIGINSVLDSRSMFSLKERISAMANKCSASVSLADFQLNDRYGTILVMRALKIIEKSYLELTGTTDIANELGINESTLCREFKRNNIASPKKLLLYFKIRHAINLMQNKGMSLKEIANHSGFSNEQRFYECFRRVYDETPNSFRSEIINV